MFDGYGSKKFLFAIGVCVLAFLYTALAATVMPRLEGMFQTFTYTLEFVTGAYLTGNIANKWVAGRVHGSKKKLKNKPVDPLDKEIPS